MDVDKALRGAAEQVHASLAEENIPGAPQRPQRRWMVPLVVAAVSIVVVGGVALITSDGDQGSVAQTRTSSATSTTTPLDESEPEPSDQPRPIGPENVIAEGDFEDADATWRLSAFLTEGDGLCIRLQGVTCGPVPDASTPLTLPSRTIGGTPGEPRLVCAFGALRSDVADVILTFSDGSTSMSPIYDGGDLPASFYAQCWAGELDVISVEAIDTGGKTLASSGDSAELVATPNSEEQGQPVDTDTSWSIAYPSTWYRADSELMPALGTDSLTLATFPLRPGGENCPHAPENALRDLGPNDALISVLFSGVARTEATAWPPDGFNDTVFPEAQTTTGNQECAERPDLEMHWETWNIEGNGVWILVVFGKDVGANERAEAWDVLSSLTPGDGDPPTDRGVCIVTRPPQPGFAPPGPYQPNPSDESMIWYGTAALWTPLRTDATYVPRKSVWWSSNFGGGGAEERPAITVTYERIDDAAPVIVSEPTGTNAYTPEDGWFMIADIDFEPKPSGCWKVTATYRGTVLSYIVEVP